MEIANINYNNQKKTNFYSYHPVLRDKWEKQITAYLPEQNFTEEYFIDWDDPYKNIRPWKIIDFLREFKLTK